MRDGLEEAADVGQLPREIRGHLLAVGFVGLEDLVAKGGAFAFPDGGQVFRLVVVDQPAQHRREDVDGFGGQAGGSAHRRHGGARAAVEGAENQAEGIDQEQAGGRGHGLLL